MTNNSKFRSHPLVLSTLAATCAGILTLTGIFLYLDPQIPEAKSYRNVKLVTPLRIYANDGALLAEFGERRVIPITLDQVPQHFINALLDTEDKRFYEHSGIDFISLTNDILSLVGTFMSAGELGGGASTITMQVARNVSFSLERRFLRKFKEMLLALKIERELSKDEILELYINLVPFGKRAYGAQAAAQANQMRFSRDREQEADRIGMQTLNNAGFDPYASSEFLTKLAAQIRYKYKPPAFLLTHPLPESRVSDVRLRAQQFEKRQLPDSLEFNLAKSRVIARYHQTPEAAENFFRKLIRENSFYNKTALNYGLGISLLDQKKLDEAAPILDELLKSDPKNLFYIDTHTDLLIAQKKAAEAVKFLAALHENRPNNQVITLNLANAALEAEQYDVAVQILKSFLLEKPEHNLGMQLLADAYKKQDNLAAYHEANADVLAQYGAYLKAADEVQKALNFVEPQELIKQQRLKALLTQYRQMQKELARL